MRPRANWLVASLAVVLPGVLWAGPLPGQSLDEAKEVEGIKDEINRFRDASNDYRGTVKHIVQREYIEKRKALTQRYQAALDSEEKEEKMRRVAAITLFENFLNKYAHDDRWTPDAMFRLAELYFEKAN